MAHTGTVAPSPLIGASVVVWANLVTVSREHGQGSIGHGGTRGAVLGFSRASRRRLLRLLAECQRAPGWFVTLTYPAEYPDIPQAKAQLKAWTRRLVRHLGAHGVDLCSLWRLERQQRGAAHFHLLLWFSPMPNGFPPTWRTDHNVADACYQFCASRGWSAEELTGAGGRWKAALTYMSGSWYHAAGRRSADHLNIGTDVAEVKSRRAVVAYVAKYIGKEDEHAFVDQETGEILATGRCWGIAGDQTLQVRRPLASYRVDAPSGSGDAVLELWRTIEGSWGLNAERNGWPTYSVFVTEEQRGEAVEFLRGRTDVHQCLSVATHAER